jgi:GNAT superfamily N-acetyltransferase
MGQGQLEFKKAEEKDIPLILEYIHKIASYEKMESQVKATPEVIKEQVFVKKAAEVLIIQLGAKPIGYLVFFTNFSTFEGRGGLYIEDIFIDEEYRHRGYGKEVFKHIAKIALERKCVRVEWTCLDWNEPSIAFYKSMGAKPMSGWTIYRLGPSEIKKLSE